MKADQEPSIVALQTAIQEMRPDVIPTNSIVGEPESNGRVGNAIRRVQEKLRVLRHQVEQGIGQKIWDGAPVMAWMRRWAAEFISKHSPGDDGKTAYERIRNECCKVLVVPFGEAVMYLPLKTVGGSKGTPAKKLGVWLGTIERTEETLVGTTKGVIKCRTVCRPFEEDRWISDLANNMEGVPWRQVPGRNEQHIPVDIDENGDILDESEENEEPPKEYAGIDEEELEYQKRAHNLHVSRKAVQKYGTTDGC